MIAESFEVTRRCKCTDQSSQAKPEQHKAKEIHRETVRAAANASNFWRLAGGKEKHTQTVKEDSSLHSQKNGSTEFIRALGMSFKPWKVRAVNFRLNTQNDDHVRQRERHHNTIR